MSHVCGCISLMRFLQSKIKDPFIGHTNRQGTISNAKKCKSKTNNSFSLGGSIKYRAGWVHLWLAFLVNHTVPFTKLGRRDQFRWKWNTTEQFYFFHFVNIWTSYGNLEGWNIVINCSIRSSGAMHFQDAYCMLLPCFSYCSLNLIFAY